MTLPLSPPPDAPDSPARASTGLEIAVIGMVLRCPGASNVDEFWRNLCDGVESIERFAPADLEVDRALADDPAYVGAGGVLDGVELFDAAFFGMHPREAAITDPQHRLFLEAAWEALEHAGHPPGASSARIGVFAGASLSTYAFNIYGNAAARGASTGLQILLGNDKDFLATRVAYKLDLRGPSVGVQTACSTSLVAVHLARNALLAGDCDMALAGGIGIRLPQRSGYLYQEGGIGSRDGRCKPFDDAASGTVAGNGLGIVVLKRLEDALADGDRIEAVILGSALNNDGARRAGYTAPGVRGQAEVIRDAHLSAGVSADTIGYVEAHGTGTLLGDPIEIAALTDGFRATTANRQFCAVGSVKGNIGHLDAAAGVAGLIKTIRIVADGCVPPSLHVERPNTRVDWSSSPFYVNTRCNGWTGRTGTPRRAGVSSFGIGGTNVHMVIEEPPRAASAPDTRSSHTIVLSARTRSSLMTSLGRLADHLDRHRDAVLADVASTLQVGRTPFRQRCAFVCADVDRAIRSLRREPAAVADCGESDDPPPVVFLFPGQGSEYRRMGEALYREEAVFREAVDACAKGLLPAMGLDIRHVLFAAPGGPDADLGQTRVTQPALFTVEYALARLWLSLGITPAAMLGHSVGELVAACLAGVFSLDDALRVVAARGAAMQATVPGGMLAVGADEAAVAGWLDASLSIAAVNAPDQCVVSGPDASIVVLERELRRRGVACHRLRTMRAFHSSLIDDALEPLAAALRQVPLKPPAVKIVSNVTGTWLTDREATSVDYWVRHVRETVRFESGLRTLFADGAVTLLEVGPGRTLAALARRHPASSEACRVVTSLPDRQRDATTPEPYAWRSALAEIWLTGVDVRWDALYTSERRLRVALPTYAFERERHWVDAPIPSSRARDAVASAPQTAAAIASTTVQAATAGAHLSVAADAATAAENEPANDVERIVAGIWQELLGIQRIGRHQDLFALGGDSLVAAQIIARVSATFPVEVPLRTIFQSPTIAGLSEALLAAQLEALDRV